MEYRHEQILKTLHTGQPLNINSISEQTNLQRNWVSKGLKELELMKLIFKIDVQDKRNKQFKLSNKGYKVSSLLVQLEDVLKG